MGPSPLEFANLVAAVTVDVGSIDEVDALLEAGVDHRPCGGFVGATAEVVGAEADEGDLEARVAEVAVFHKRSFRSEVWRLLGAVRDVGAIIRAAAAHRPCLS